MNYLTPDRALLRLLQLASPLLPVGGYSYSEGLELLIAREIIHDRGTLQDWIERELTVGSIRLETYAMDRAYLAAGTGDIDNINYWNQWLSSARETAELRQQSWQMGGSLAKLLIELTPDIVELLHPIGLSSNYAIVFGIAAQHWHISLEDSILSYLHSWATNLVSAGVKLIPLGQTAGQQLLWELQSTLDRSAHQIIQFTEDDLYSCSWGLSLASMQHETLYSRLFRS
jgi:urease accessory protein